MGGSDDCAGRHANVSIGTQTGGTTQCITNLRFLHLLLGRASFLIAMSGLLLLPRWLLVIVAENIVIRVTLRVCQPLCYPLRSCQQIRFSSEWRKKLVEDGLQQT